MLIEKIINLPSLSSSTDAVYYFQIICNINDYNEMQNVLFITNNEQYATQIRELTDRQRTSMPYNSDIRLPKPILTKSHNLDKTLA